MNDQCIKLLLVEDEAVCAALVQEMLTSASASPFAVTRVKRLGEALERVGQDRFDVALLDLALPDGHGLRTYAELHARAPALPIIVLTGCDDEKLALQAVREGAQDYLVKGQWDGRMLGRVIRYAIERKRASEALRRSEEFFRLISENVNDLITVIDKDGRRLYKSPSYQRLRGEAGRLAGSDSFEEVHPEDRERVRQIFLDALATGVGRRAEHRMLLRDGSVRHVESQGSVIKDETGRPSQVVVVSRDITERKEAVEALREALSDLKKSHEKLQATQLQLIQSEKLEAVNTFAAGVAHEVKNPLQTIILGIDYLAGHVAAGDANAELVLNEMGEAVKRADAIIHGLLEFSAPTKSQVQAENLSGVVEQSLRAVENELANYPVRVAKELAADLPALRLDAKTMKHVFINLLMYAIRAVSDGGSLLVRTAAFPWTEARSAAGKTPSFFKVGDLIVVAEVEAARDATRTEKGKDPGSSTTVITKGTGKTSGLGLAVLKKIVELHGGALDISHRKGSGRKYTVMFKAQRKPTI